jgi:hypothetical protein
MLVLIFLESSNPYFAVVGRCMIELFSYQASLHKASLLKATSQQTDEIDIREVKMLIDRLKEGERELRRELFAASFIVRNSSGSPEGGGEIDKLG